MLVPLLTIFSHLLSLKIKTSERKVSIIDELPFFTTYASIMESVNISLYSSLIGLANTPSSLYSKFSSKKD